MPRRADDHHGSPLATSPRAAAASLLDWGKSHMIPPFTPMAKRRLCGSLVVSAAPAPGAAGGPPVGAASLYRCRAEKGRTPENRTRRSS